MRWLKSTATPANLEGYYFTDLISIAIGAFPILIDIYNGKPIDDKTLLLALCWFGIASFFTSWAARARMHREIAKSHKDINDRLTAMTMVEHCGTARAARQKLISGLMGANEVYNVYINTISNAAPAGFDYNDPAEFRILYGNMLQNPQVHWEDIIGDNIARYAERFQGMGVPAATSANFHCHQLAHAYPSVNFTVFKQPAGNKEVMFGFGLHDAQQNGDVFWSRDTRVVGYFESLFSAMRAKATPVELNQIIQP
jgi:hypothetical protein